MWQAKRTIGWSERWPESKTMLELQWLAPLLLGTSCRRDVSPQRVFSRGILCPEIALCLDQGCTLSALSSHAHSRRQLDCRFWRTSGANLFRRHAWLILHNHGSFRAKGCGGHGNPHFSAQAQGCRMQENWHHLQPVLQELHYTGVPSGGVRSSCHPNT